MPRKSRRGGKKSRRGGKSKKRQGGFLDAIRNAANKAHEFAQDKLDKAKDGFDKGHAAAVQAQANVTHKFNEAKSKAESAAGDLQDRATVATAALQKPTVAVESKGEDVHAGAQNPVHVNQQPHHLPQPSPHPAPGPQPVPQLRSSSTPVRNKSKVSALRTHSVGGRKRRRKSRRKHKKSHKKRQKSRRKHKKSRKKSRRKHKRRR